MTAIKRRAVNYTVALVAGILFALVMWGMIYFAFDVLPGTPGKAIQQYDR